ncbi:hypothetical protein ACHAXT_010896 [Thalassiosira profunda]
MPKHALSFLLLLAAAMLAPTVRSFAARSAVGASRRLAAARGIGGINSISRGGLTSSAPAPFRRAAAPSASTRWMSSPTDAETSVVETCRSKIAAALETEDVKVVGAYDDPNGSHIAIEVTSAMFEGKRPVQRQQLVYKALWEELQGAVHAVDSMICKTPEEK